MGVRPELKGFSYIRLRELVFEAFTGIVPDLACIGTHSLRSGGATASSTLLRHAAGLVFPPKLSMLKTLRLPVCLFLRP